MRRRSGSGRRPRPDRRLVTNGDSSAVVLHAISADIVGELVDDTPVCAAPERDDLSAHKLPSWEVVQVHSHGTLWGSITRSVLGSWPGLGGVRGWDHH